jgi:hypothetical protein
MRTKPKWDPDNCGWSKKFKLDKPTFEKLAKLTSKETAEALQGATHLFYNRKSIQDSAPKIAETRQALADLQNWIARGNEVLPKGDTTLDCYGWDDSRIGSLINELAELDKAARQILTKTKTQSGTPTKYEQLRFARHVARILMSAQIRVTGTRTGLFNKALGILFDAAGESKDTHRIAELVVKDLH